MKKEVVITSIGINSPIGLNLTDFKNNMFAGKSGVISLIARHGFGINFPVPYGAIILQENLANPKLDLKIPTNEWLKSWHMTALATEEALNSIKFNDQIDGIIYGTADGISYELVSQSLKKPKLNNFNFDKVCCETSLNIINKILIQKGFDQIKSKNMISINGACASGNQALGLAFQKISIGKWKRCLVGGVDARCEASNFLNFKMLGALSTADLAPEKASRPFSHDRSGFVRGEGAVTLIVEEKSEAIKRGAHIYGQISGYGCTSDAYRLTDGREDIQSVKKAMQLAINSADISIDDINYINAHGTSTMLNDRLESKAIKEIFKKRAYDIPISSLKSQIGHSTIAAGSLEAVACMLMIQEQKIAPTLNWAGPDKDCDLDYVPNKTRQAKVDTILSNNFGFGGQNACIVFKKDTP